MNEQTTAMMKAVIDKAEETFRAAERSFEIEGDVIERSSQRNTSGSMEMNLHLVHESRRICRELYVSHEAVIAALEDCRKVDIRNIDGLPAENLLYQLRQDGESQWLFVCPFVKNVKITSEAQRNADGSVPCQKVEITVNGLWEPHLYDTINGKVLPIGFRHENGKTVVMRDLYPSDSLLIRFSEPHYHEFVPQTDEKLVLARCDYKQTVPYTRAEDNVLLLDLPDIMEQQSLESKMDMRD